MELVVLLVTLALLGTFCYLIPRIGRRGLLFGVYVGEESSEGEEARRITRSWNWRIAAWLLLCFLLAAVATPYYRAAGTIVAALLVSFAGFVIEFIRAHYQARRLAVAGSPRLSAAAVITTGKPVPLVMPYVAMAIGFVGAAIAVGYTWAHFGELPVMFPTHFGPSGAPDDWMPKSYATVMMLPIVSLVVCVGLGLIALLTGRAKRSIRTGDNGVSFEAQERFRTIMARFLAGLSMSVTVLMTTLSICAIRVAVGAARTLPRSLDAIVVGMVICAVGGSLIIALRYGQGGSRLEHAATDTPLTNGLADNKLWVLGMFYVNRDDPSILVEKRFGLGYTINFGNRLAVAFIVVFVALILLMPAVMALVGR